MFFTYTAYSFATSLWIWIRLQFIWVVQGYIEWALGFLSVADFSLSGYPLVSSLRYDNQSRTFTCTSTGGPATIVTWRKDGAVITSNATYQQTKRVVDPAVGTYQTVLTTDPSVSQSDIVGLYSCTVENARGRSAQVVTGNGELILTIC